MTAQAHWMDFYLTAAGAAAALAGLVIVAVSANLKEILRFPSLPAQAAASIGALVLILVSSMAGLIPGQGSGMLGWEVVIFSLPAWWLQVRANRQFTARQPKRPWGEVLASVVMGQAQVLPFIIGGLVLLTGNDTGRSWVAAGILTIFAFAMLNVWVLLVEIRR